MKLTKKLQATAYHEAGHAVAAWRLGIRIKKLSIVPHSGSDGRMMHGRYFRGSEIETSASSATTRRIENMIIVSCAGMWAQKKFHPRSHWRADAGGDHDQCIDLILRLSGNNEIQQVYFHLLELRARVLVYQLHNWPLVETLAATLIDQREMTGKQVRETLIEAEQQAMRRYRGSAR